MQFLMKYYEFLQTPNGHIFISYPINIQTPFFQFTLKKIWALNPTFIKDLNQQCVSYLNQ